MKKTLVFWTFLALLFGLTGLASAAQNVANTNQKGSLLVFPKIDVSYGRDTRVRIGNDSPAAVRVQCFWENDYLQNQRFDFIVPGNMSGWIEAKTGMSSDRFYMGDSSFPIFDYEAGVIEIHAHTGELKCFAVDLSAGVPISWNHLFGSAEIWDGCDSVSVYGYNAWAFTARAVPQGAPVGQPGQLNLSGLNGAYDACPAYLTSEFLSAPIGSGFGTSVTLVPCIQDFRQDAVHVGTKAKFDIWDANGSKTGDAYKCITKFFDGFLQDIGPGTDPWTGLPIGGLGGYNFVHNTCQPYLDNGRFRVTAMKSSVCESAYYYSFWRDLTTIPTLPSPIPGYASFWYDIQGVGPTGSTVNTSFLGVVVKYPMGGHTPYAKTPASAGYDPGGVVRYDPGSSSIANPEFK
jgi:hypothetical protein